MSFFARVDPERPYQRTAAIAAASLVAFFVATSAALGQPAMPSPASVGSACTFDSEAARNASAALDWASDYVGQNWVSRSKYFILTAVTSINAPSDPNALPFTATDVNLIKNTLCRFGYQPVSNDSQIGVLTGPQATRDHVSTAIGQLRGIPQDEDPLVIFYYSGHAVTSGDANGDLFLQFAEQTQIDTAHGTPLSDVVRRIRSVYKGELVIILDACYSGTAAVSDVLSAPVFAGVTIITSSADNQVSYPIDVDGQQVSAFSDALVRGLTQDLDRLDADRDGIVWADDLAEYTTVVLADFAHTGRIPRRMTPYLTVLRKKLVVAYDRGHLSDPNTLPRQYWFAISVTNNTGMGTTVANVFRAIAGAQRVTAPASVVVEVRDVNATERLASGQLTRASATGASSYEAVLRLPTIVTKDDAGRVVEKTVPPVLNVLVGDEHGNTVSQTIDLSSLTPTTSTEALKSIRAGGSASGSAAAPPPPMAGAGAVSTTAHIGGATIRVSTIK